jgi:hypothetical protein
MSTVRRNTAQKEPDQRRTAATSRIKCIIMPTDDAMMDAGRQEMALSKTAS